MWLIVLTAGFPITLATGFVPVYFALQTPPAVYFTEYGTPFAYVGTNFPACFSEGTCSSYLPPDIVTVPWLFQVNVLFWSALTFTVILLLSHVHSD